jgi:hypothetical protein
MKPTMERAELELADRERGADSESLAEVVQADPDRDQQREVNPLQRPPAAPETPSSQEAGDPRRTSPAPPSDGERGLARTPVSASMPRKVSSPAVRP